MEVKGKSRNWWKFATVGLVVLLAVSMVMAFYQPKVDLTAEAKEPLPLEVSITGPLKIGADSPTTYTAVVNNSVGELVFDWSITPVDEKTTLIWNGASCVLTFVVATEDVYELKVNVVDSATGFKASASTYVYDPYTQTNLYLGASASGYSYKVMADGRGWYQCVNGTDQSVVSALSSTNPSTTINGALAYGGLIKIMAGSYTGAALVVPGNAYLVADPKVTGITYTSIASGAKIDEPAFNACFGGYSGGSYTIVTGSSAVASGATWYLAFEPDNSISWSSTDNGEIGTGAMNVLQNCVDALSPTSGGTIKILQNPNLVNAPSWIPVTATAAYSFLALGTLNITKSNVVIEAGNGAEDYDPYHTILIQAIDINSTVRGIEGVKLSGIAMLQLTIQGNHVIADCRFDNCLIQGSNITGCKGLVFNILSGGQVSNALFDHCQLKQTTQSANYGCITLQGHNSPQVTFRDCNYVTIALNGVLYDNLVFLQSNIDGSLSGIKFFGLNTFIYANNSYLVYVNPSASGNGVKGLLFQGGQIQNTKAITLVGIASSSVPQLCNILFDAMQLTPYSITPPSYNTAPITLIENNNVNWVATQNYVMFMNCYSVTSYNGYTNSGQILIGTPNTAQYFNFIMNPVAPLFGEAPQTLISMGNVNTTVTSGLQLASGNVRGIVKTASQSGYIISITAQVASLDGTPIQYALYLVEDDTPTTLLGYTQAVNPPEKGTFIYSLVTAYLNKPVYIANGTTYLLCASPSSGNLAFGFSDQTAVEWTASSTWPTLPNPYVGELSGGNRNYDIWANYLPIF